MNEGLLYVTPEYAVYIRKLAEKRDIPPHEMVGRLLKLYHTQRALDIENNKDTV